MAIAADTRPSDAAGIQRRRGGFMRAADDTPWITHPTDLRKGGWPGNKPDLLTLCAERGIEVPEKITIAKIQELLGPCPLRVPYGSPSGAGKQIENTYNLTKWGERRFAYGIGLDHQSPLPVKANNVTYPSLAAACVALAGMDIDSDDYKALADACVVVAKDAAQINLAADKGTFTHSLSEDSDEGRDWEQRAAAGELLGIPAAGQARLVEAWRAMLEREGLEILAVEFSCVDDIWHLAGTGDRIALLTRDLRFAMITGEIVVVPAGTIVILDIKSGQMRIASRGAILYWQGYSIQIRSYAQSLPYDTETETRGEWPWEISLSHGLIAHLDINAAVDGAPLEQICRLVYVDLEAGKVAGDLVQAAKAWDSLNGSKSTTFSVSQLRDESSSAAEAEAPAPGQPTEVQAMVEGPADPSTEIAAQDDATPTSPPQSAQPAAGEVLPSSPAAAPIDFNKIRRAQLLDRFNALGTDDRNRFKAAGVNMTDLDAVADVLAAIETTATVTAPDVRRALITREITAAAAESEWSGPTFTGTEGDLVSDRVRDDMRISIETLTAEQKADLDAVAGTAFRTVGSIAMARLQSRRRWEIARALVFLARYGWDDGLVRASLVDVTGDEACEQPGIPLGVIVGLLELDQAIAWGELTASIACGGHVPTAADGRWQWVPATAA